MIILVTGGAGYIGSHVVSLLGETNHDIIIYDNLSTGRKENILHGKLIIGDLNNSHELENVFIKNKIEAVMHFAGSIIVPESVENPILYYKNNTDNSLNLIRICVKYNVNKFIFSSTAAVYGMPKNGIASEDTPTEPITPYGRSKLMTEWMLNDISKAHDFFYIALRYFNVAGASRSGRIGQSTPKATHLIKTAAEVATKKRKRMFIYGDNYETKDGTCIRDYIHVDDLAQAHLDALTFLSQNKKSQILNCGYGEGYTVKEVIKEVELHTKCKLNIEISPRRLGDAVKLISKADKIKDVLRWEPRYNNLPYIVSSAIEWEKKLTT